MYFSTFNLRSGYNQLLMEPDDTKKTTFVTRRGLYEYKLMPFGLCNALFTFQRLMEITSDRILYYLYIFNDIIVYSKTITEHPERLEFLFRRLVATNLNLKPLKCFVLQKKVVFLGHTICDKGLGTKDNKIESVRDWRTPKSVKDIIKGRNHLFIWPTMRNLKISLAL